MTGNPHPMSGFDEPVRRWQDIPGWFQWRLAQQEAVAQFGDGSRFVEVGCYLGRSVCSLAEEVQASGRAIVIIGVDTARGSGPEGRQDTNAHGPAVQHGDGTFAGLLHRNVIACGFADSVQLLISDSIAAAQLFVDESFAWVHIDARHDTAAFAPISQPGHRRCSAAAGCPATITTNTSGLALSVRSEMRCRTRGVGVQLNGGGSSHDP